MVDAPISNWFLSWNVFCLSLGGNTIVGGFSVRMSILPSRSCPVSSSFIWITVGRLRFVYCKFVNKQVIVAIDNPVPETKGATHINCENISTVNINLIRTILVTHDALMVAVITTDNDSAMMQSLLTIKQEPLINHFFDFLCLWFLWLMNPSSVATMMLAQAIGLTTEVACSLGFFFSTSESLR